MSVISILMGSNHKKKFEEELESKFMCPTKFALDIEKLVAESDDLNYIEAILLYCEEKGIETESISKLINKQLKRKIEVDAIQLNFLKKKRERTLAF